MFQIIETVRLSHKDVPINVKWCFCFSDIVSHLSSQTYLARCKNVRAPLLVRSWVNWVKFHWPHHCQAWLLPDILGKEITNKTIFSDHKARSKIDSVPCHAVHHMQGWMSAFQLVIFNTNFFLLCLGCHSHPQRSTCRQTANMFPSYGTRTVSCLCFRIIWNIVLRHG